MKTRIMGFATLTLVGIFAMGGMALGQAPLHRSGGGGSGTSSCVASQVKASGTWSFTYPAKPPAVGGRVTAKAEIVLTNRRNTPCQFDRHWPSIRLLDRHGMKLNVHEQETDGKDAVGTPMLDARGGTAAEAIEFQWINWCHGKIALPVKVRYDILPGGGSKILHLGLGHNTHFHVPGCVDPMAKSVLHVKPYLAVALPSK